MASFVETLQKTTKLLPRRPYTDDLPLSQSPANNAGGAAAHLIGMRKRISSSFSVNIQPIASSASTEWWPFRNSHSMPSLGAAYGAAAAGLPLWRIWWGWLLSRKAAFAKDLEMNEEETSTLGRRGKGSWGHVFYRLRSEICKLVQSSGGSGTSLPTKQEFRHDSFSYAHTIPVAAPLQARG